jgi:hypothetical protein
MLATIVRSALALNAHPSPASQQSGDGGLPGKKIASTCSCPILQCRSSITFCASATAGALLPRPNSSPARFTSSGFQLLIIVG